MFLYKLPSGSCFNLQCPNDTKLYVLEGKLCVDAHPDAGDVGVAVKAGRVQPFTLPCGVVYCIVPWDSGPGTVFETSAILQLT